jgi:hypothetical protein
VRARLVRALAHGLTHPPAPRTSPPPRFAAALRRRRRRRRRAADFIDWHHDVNFYHGRHFTVLLPLIVEEGVDAQLQAVVPEGSAVRRLTLRSEGAGAGAADPLPVVCSESASQTLVAPWTARGNEFPGARVTAVPSIPGRLVIFEGEYVFHRVTPMGEGGAAAAAAAAAAPAAALPSAAAVEARAQKKAEDASATAEAAEAAARGPRRVILSMTFTTDPRITMVVSVRRARTRSRRSRARRARARVPLLTLPHPLAHAGRGHAAPQGHDVLWPARAAKLSEGRELQARQESSQPRSSARRPCAAAAAAGLMPRARRRRPPP